MMMMMDMVRESSELLFSDLPLLLFITLLFFFPVSAISLTHILNASHLHTLLLRLLPRHPSSPAAPLLYHHSLQTLAAEAASLPATLSLKIAAYVAVWHLAAWRRAGRRRDLEEILGGAADWWRRIAATYLCGEAAFGTLLLAFALAVGAGGGFAVNVAAAAALTLALPILLAVVRFGMVAAAFRPPLCGPRALLYSLSLLNLRHRLHPALLILFFSTAATTFFEFAFHTRILGIRNGGGSGPPPPPSAALCRFLEAPLLIFAHAFVSLFDSILCFSFFHSVAGDDHSDDSLVACDEEEEHDDGLLDFDGIDDVHQLQQIELETPKFHRRCSAVEDDEYSHQDHFTVAVDILERHRGKLMNGGVPSYILSSL